MAQRGYVSHITPDRKGPNRMLRESGYPLPDSYLNGLANNVESIVGGIDAPEAVWQALIDSPDHRPHLLGEGPGFLSQDEFGIAYFRDIHAPHVDYWVVIIARRPQPGEPELLCTPAPSVCFRTGTVPSAGPSAGPSSGDGPVPVERERERERASNTPR